MPRLLANISTRISTFMSNGKLRSWLVIQLSQRTTWVQIFVFVSSLTGANLSPHFQDAIATAGVVLCTMIGIASPDRKE